MSKLQIPKKKIFEYLKDSKVKIIENYLKKGMSPNMTRSKDDMTRLIDFAAEHSTIEMLSLLVRYGANIEPEEEFSFMCKAPISLAAKGNKLENVNYLLSVGANPNPKTSWQPLTWAAEHCNLEMMKTLLEQGAYPNLFHFEEEEYVNEETPVYVSVRKWNMDGVSLLLEYGGKLTKPNRRYSSPLSHAIINGKYDVVKFLLANGAPVNEMSVHSTALRMAIENINRINKDENKANFDNMISIIKLLLNSGANRFEDLKKYGYTSNSLMQLVQHLEVLELFEAYLDDFSKEEQEICLQKKLPLLVKN